MHIYKFCTVRQLDLASRLIRNLQTTVKMTSDISLSISSTYKLSNGNEMPFYGFGTYKMKDEEILHNAIDVAIKSGIRLIDTAAVYDNEHMVGVAIKKACSKHSLDLSDIFVTTKLRTKDQGYSPALSACEASLQALGRDYVDLYLIHWPGVQGQPRDDPSNAEARKGSWRALEELHRAGKAKAIGVSNYTVKHLQELLEYATIKPHVLQSECHPLLPQRDVREFCAEHNIFFQAYSSLGTGDDKLLKHDKLLAVSRKYPNKTTAQILLAWALQQGMGIIPKASSAARIRENTELFDVQLSKEDKDTLNVALDEGYHFCWDPNGVA